MGLATNGSPVTKSQPDKRWPVQTDTDGDKGGHMELQANRQGGPSPFSRPPQPPAPSAFARPVAAPLTSQPTAPPSAEHQALERQRRGGGQWFYWIAGLSLINAALAFSGQQWRFILGLGVTQLVQEMAASGNAGTIGGLVGVALIVVFAVLGQRAIVGHAWAFLAGMILFGLDGLLFVLIQDWVGVAFHAFALWMIGRGYAAARQLPPIKA